MPGIATNFKILDLCLERLTNEAPAHPELLPVIQVLQEHAPFAYLGVIGPSLADFMQPNATDNAYARLWRSVFGLVGDNLANEDGPGLFSVISLIRRTLDRAIDAATDEDLIALGDLEKEEGKIKQALEDIDDLVDLLLDPDFLGDMGRIILQDLTPTVTPSLQPYIQTAEEEGFLDLPPAVKLQRLSDILEAGHTIPPPSGWTIREVLFWKRTGQFAKALLDMATEPNQQAYAFGYLISYVSNVVGSPFINSIVGSTYRLNWWRTRWIQLFVDTWVHGFYEAGATMSGDTPTPSYDNEDLFLNLTEAKLQERIIEEGVELDPQDLMGRLWREEPFDNVLPESFTDYWRNAFQQVYPELPQSEAISSQTINGAYQLTWLVLWFQTSGELLHFVPHVVETIEDDEDCGEMPPWAEPPGPPEEEETEESDTVPELEGTPDKGKFICGIILAILGGLSLIVTALGAVGLGIGIWLAKGAAPDWPELRCGLFWRKQKLDLTVLKFHDLLVVAGLVHPYPRHLTMEENVEMPDESGEGTIITDIVTYHSALKTAKSQSLTDFPKQAIASDLLFGVFPFLAAAQQVMLGEAEAEELTLWTEPPDPEAPVEEPTTMAYAVSAYPDFFISNQLNLLIGPGVLTQIDLADADSPPPPFEGLGNAVDNVVHLFLNQGAVFPDWNLDGDRGRFYPTWQFATDHYSNTDPVSIVEEA